MKNPNTAETVRNKLKGKVLSKEAVQNMANGHKKKVLCIETGIIYNSRNEAAKSIGISPSGIGRAATGEQKTAGGYHWRYINEN